MPWRETSPMEQRLQFVTEYASGVFSMIELAEQYGITPKTGYKWIDRYAHEGAVGLLDRSRRPHQHPQAIGPAIVEAVLAVRRRHPRWGASKLLEVAARQTPGAAWPSRSTVCRWLRAHGFVRERRRRSRPMASPVLRVATAPNEVWTTDFKGQFRTGDGVYCYPLTLRDSYSRYVLRCDALRQPTYAATRARFERAFREYGLPARIRSDNGTPFASTGFARLSRLCVWWMRLGIVPERIAPGHPEQNGSHEQFHAVLKAETTRPPATTLHGQQQRFGHFCREYNRERPHAALAYAVPATGYTPSPRHYPPELPPLEYPSHMEVRRIYRVGQFGWRGTLVFLSEALAGEDVGFEEVDDGVWTIFFGAVPLGRFDERHHKVYPLATISAGRSASAAGCAPAITTHERNAQ
jgi:transposase InsO family protein